MAWAFELYLDVRAAESVAAVSDPRLWGDPARGSTGHPHVSLGVAEGLAELQVVDLLHQWANDVDAIPVTFDHWGLFLSESAVLFLSPRDRGALYERQQRFFNAFGLLLDGYWDYYRPERWVPHCTVADSVPVNGLGLVTERARQLRLPFETSLDRLALVEFRPGRYERHERLVVGLE